MSRARDMLTGANLATMVWRMLAPSAFVAGGAETVRSDAEGIVTLFDKAKAHGLAFVSSLKNDDNDPTLNVGSLLRGVNVHSEREPTY